MNNRMAFLLSAICLSTACASEDPYQDLDIDTLEQEQHVKLSPGFTYGLNTSTADHRACTGTSTSETCAVPSARNFNYFLSGVDPEPVSGIAWKAKMRTTLANVAGQTFGNFTFTEVFSAPTGTPGVVITAANHCGAGVASTAISDYVCPVFGTSSTVMNDGSLQGTYKAINTITQINLDMQDIAVRGAAGNFTDALVNHAMGHGALYILGLGSRIDTTTFMSSRSIFPATPRTIMTAGERCRAGAFSLADSSLFSADLGLCSTD